MQSIVLVMDFFVAFLEDGKRNAVYKRVQCTAWPDLAPGPTA